MIVVLAIITPFRMVTTGRLSRRHQCQQHFPSRPASGRSIPITPVCTSRCVTSASRTCAVVSTALMRGWRSATTSTSTRFGATIDIATIDTNQADRDAHLLSTDFFAADAHPTLTFTSTAIRDAGGGEFEADGELTINGITKLDHARRRVHRRRGSPRRRQTALRLHRQHASAARRLRDRLQHAARRRQVRPRQEDRRRDRRAVHSTAGLIRRRFVCRRPGLGT